MDYLPGNLAGESRAGFGTHMEEAAEVVQQPRRHQLYPPPHTDDFLVAYCDDDGATDVAVAAAELLQQPVDTGDDDGHDGHDGLDESAHENVCGSGHGRVHDGRRLHIADDGDDVSLLLHVVTNDEHDKRQQLQLRLRRRLQHKRAVAVHDNP